MFRTSLLRLPRRTSLAVLRAVGAAILVTVALQSAMADLLFNTGNGVFQVQATNSPDTFTNLANLPGTTSLDGGALQLTASIVPVPMSSSEWLVFNYSTASGGPLSQPSLDWAINQVGLNALVPVNFTQAYVQFSDNGTVLTPTSSIFGGYSVEANPVPGGSGTGLGTASFVAPFPVGPLPALGAFINPFSFLNDTGINSADVNGYTQALEFSPQSSVPEPASLAVWGSLGALGVCIAAIKRHRMLKR